MRCQANSYTKLWCKNWSFSIAITLSGKFEQSESVYKEQDKKLFCFLGLLLKRHVDGTVDGRFQGWSREKRILFSRCVSSISKVTIVGLSGLQRKENFWFLLKWIGSFQRRCHLRSDWTKYQIKFNVINQVLFSYVKHGSPSTLITARPFHSRTYPC